MSVAGVFHDTFHSLSHVTPQVLYPVPDCRLSTVQQSEQHSLIPDDVHVLFLSINRYERKKNIALALDALGSSSVDVHCYVGVQVSLYNIISHDTTDCCLTGQLLMSHGLL